MKIHNIPLDLERIQEETWEEISIIKKKSSKEKRPAPEDLVGKGITNVN